ncbi:MAG TPA: NADH-ubiquinone oxidoreductase-F iron-sulfur binding region domain-containing protein [Pseudonocardiaceae bacterium]|jgi:NADH:ubiquinone oxidoreductase subunit F (NADH-binding)|nr:NADH-ubiquinone oxidoreductase-F iron-sulfur binding region domain-containing protein [Pseudonocardiaceae bacterium]
MSAPTLSAAAVGLLAGWRETGRPADLAEHLDRYGELPIGAFPGRAGRERLIELVESAGLRGRGGAGFPTSVKLRAVAAGRRRAVVVANGCEGEPASQKDHALLTVAPHLVLDGLQLAAHAVGAGSLLCCVHRGDPLAATLHAALAQRGHDRLPVEIVEVPARFAASEESALVNFINTGTAKPTVKPPRPFERGVRGRPTLVDNVETLAHLALIARYGPAAFRAIGTADSPGSTLLTVAGAVATPGVREVALGTTIGRALTYAGGETEPLQAILAGGYGGSWLPFPAAADLPLTHQDFRAAGASLGVGLLLALPARACGIAETVGMLRYLADESARQCGPCMFGLPAIAADFAELATGSATVAAMNRLRGRLGVITGRGACAHPDGAVRLAASALRVFDRDVRAHLAGRPCPAARARPWLAPKPSVRETGWT